MSLSFCQRRVASFYQWRVALILVFLFFSNRLCNSYLLAIVRSRARGPETFSSPSFIFNRRNFGIISTVGEGEGEIAPFHLSEEARKAHRSSYIKTFLLLICLLSPFDSHSLSFEFFLHLFPHYRHCFRQLFFSSSYTSTKMSSDEGTPFFELCPLFFYYFGILLFFLFIFLLGDGGGRPHGEGTTNHCQVKRW